MRLSFSEMEVKKQNSCTFKPVDEEFVSETGFEIHYTHITALTSSCHSEFFLFLFLVFSDECISCIYMSYTNAEDEEHK